MPLSSVAGRPDLPWRRGADEAIHSVIDVMAAELPYTTLQHTVHIHPTVSELIPTILGELSG